MFQDGRCSGNFVAHNVENVRTDTEKGSGAIVVQISSSEQEFLEEFTYRQS